MFGLFTKLTYVDIKKPGKSINPTDHLKKKTLERQNTSINDFVVRKRQSTAFEASPRKCEKVGYGDAYSTPK